MRKLLTLGQAICGFGIFGTVGAMERDASMTVGEGVIQALLFFGLLMFCQFMKECAKVLAKQKACSERAFRTRKAYRVGKHQTVR